MISAIEARKQQNKNIDDQINLAIDEISKKINDVIRRANESKVIHFQKSKKLSDLIAKRIRDHGYEVDINRSDDLRDSDLYQITVKW